LNFEIGHKAQMSDGRLRIDTSLFYMVRHNEQLLTDEQLSPSDPNTFIFFTGNAKSVFQLRLGEHGQLGCREEPGVRRLSRPAARASTTDSCKTA